MDNNKVLRWAPNYTLKRHNRAKRIKLKVSLYSGLEIIVPHTIKLININKILADNREWIEQHIHKIDKIKNIQLPNFIELHAINEKWNVNYEASSDLKAYCVERPHFEVVVVGNIKDPFVCKNALIQWIKEKAKCYLTRYISLLSDKAQLSYQKVTIKYQKNRWGSCSSKKSINLNYKLIFLPLKLVNYIVIHELCHTIHMDHSQKFWDLVATHLPEWKLYCTDLRNADNWIPAWVEVSFNNL